MFDHGQADVLIRVPDVANILGISKASVYKYMHTMEDFPRPIRLGAKLVAWSRNDVYAWLERKKAEPRTSRPRIAPPRFQGKAV
jgi:predicted DNA-binding transcriptional regulator AlpA